MLYGWGISGWSWYQISGIRQSAFTVARAGSTAVSPSCKRRATMTMRASSNKKEQEDRVALRRAHTDRKSVVRTRDGDVIEGALPHLIDKA